MRGEVISLECDWMRENRKWKQIKLLPVAFAPTHPLLIHIETTAHALLCCGQRSSVSWQKPLICCLAQAMIRHLDVCVHVCARVWVIISNLVYIFSMIPFMTGTLNNSLTKLSWYTGWEPDLQTSITLVSKVHNTTNIIAWQVLCFII